MNAILRPAPPRLRPLVEADLDRLAGIESRAYARGWARGIFADCLRATHYCRGIECAGQLAGYAIVSFGPGEAHLLNLAVDPCFQCRGLGGMLLAHVTATARSAGVECIFLEVRPSNAAALALYAREGFIEFGRRRDYYPASVAAGREDALILCRRL